MEFDRQRAIKAEADKIAANKQLCQNQRAVLQRQIAEREEAARQAQAQAEEDKRTVEEIIGRINSEDERDQRLKKESQIRTAALVREYEKKRQIEVAAKKQREKEEEDKIAEYQRNMDARSQGVAAKKEAKKLEEDRILAKIVEETERKRKEEEEFNELRDMLWEEELESKKRQQEEGMFSYISHFFSH